MLPIAPTTINNIKKIFKGLLKPSPADATPAQPALGHLNVAYLELQRTEPRCGDPTRPSTPTHTSANPVLR